MTVSLVPILLAAPGRGSLVELAPSGDEFGQMLGGVALQAPGAEALTEFPGSVASLRDAASPQTGKAPFDASQLVAVFERKAETSARTALPDTAKPIPPRSGAESIGSVGEDEVEQALLGETSVLPTTAAVPENATVLPTNLAAPSVMNSPKRPLQQLTDGGTSLSHAVRNTVANATRSEGATPGKDVTISSGPIAEGPENPAIFLAMFASPSVTTAPERRSQQLDGRKAVLSPVVQNSVLDTPWPESGTPGKNTKTLPTTIMADTMRAVASVGDSSAIATMIASAAPTADSVNIARSTDAATVLVAGTPTAYTRTEIVERQLDLARDERWVNQLARDIISLSSQTDRIAFRLHPERLGQLDVLLAQGDAGFSIRMTTEHREAHAILSQAQPRLVEDMRSQGLRIAQAEVSSGAQGDHQRSPPHQDRPALIEASQDIQIRPLPTSSEPVSGRFA
jgi:flagellar hook-length control protein FliK